MAKYTIDNRSGAINWEVGAGNERILQNARNLLCAKLGEVPYDRLRGLNTAVFHKGMETANVLAVQDVDRLMEWEPEIAQVDEVRAFLSDGQIIIEADVTIDE